MQALLGEIKKIRAENSIIIFPSHEKGYVKVFGAYTLEKINKIRPAFTVYAKFIVRKNGGFYIRQLTIENTRSNRLSWVDVSEVLGKRAKEVSTAKRFIITEGKKNKLGLFTRKKGQVIKTSIKKLDYYDRLIITDYEARIATTDNNKRSMKPTKNFLSHWTSPLHGNFYDAWHLHE